MTTPTTEKAPAKPKRTPAATPAVPFWVRLNTAARAPSARSTRRALTRQNRGRR